MNLTLPLAFFSASTISSDADSGTTEGSDVKCWGGNNRGQLGYGALWDTDLGDAEPIDSIGAVTIE